MQLASGFVYHSGLESPLLSLHLVCNQKKEAQNISTSCLISYSLDFNRGTPNGLLTQLNEVERCSKEPFFVCLFNLLRPISPNTIPSWCP